MLKVNYGIFRKLLKKLKTSTHIGVLMLISKLIFYKSYVDNQTWSDLSPMAVPNNIRSSKNLEELIWGYFNTFREIAGNFNC